MCTPTAYNLFGKTIKLFYYSYYNGEVQVTIGNQKKLLALGFGYRKVTPKN